MNIKLPQSWTFYLRLLKIVAVIILVLLVLVEPRFFRNLGIRPYETLWLIGGIMFLFVFSSAYQFYHHQTPSINAFKQLKSIQKEIIHFIPITHYSVHLRIMSNDLLYLFFASNLIYLSFRIHMVKWGGLLLGALLILIHTYSLFISIRYYKFVGIYITEHALVYYEYSMEHILWKNIQKIKLGGVALHIYEEDEEMHELDFEDEEKDFEPFYERLKEKAAQHQIPIEVIPEESWINEGFTPTLKDD